MHRPIDGGRMRPPIDPSDGVKADRSPEHVTPSRHSQSGSVKEVSELRVGRRHCWLNGGRVGRIQWGTSKSDPDLYIPRTSNDTFVPAIGPDSLPPDAQPLRQPNYDNYSSITPYHRHSFHILIHDYDSSRSNHAISRLDDYSLVIRPTFLPISFPPLCSRQ